MWNKPQLLTALSDLLFVAAAAALLVSAVIWSIRLPLFPLQEIVIMHELKEVRRSEVERALSGRLRGNFFSVNLEGLRQSLEQIPWVRHAEVRRQWPSRLDVSIEEHVATAFWGQASGQLVNTHGEVFAASLNAAPDRPMPVLTGPSGLAPEMLTHLRQAETLLATIGRTPTGLNVSARLAVTLRLDDGMIVELGRQQAKAPLRQRLERFVEHYQTMLRAVHHRPGVVDMRYPNGFTLRMTAFPATENKGKP